MADTEQQSAAWTSPNERSRTNGSLGTGRAIIPRPAGAGTPADPAPRGQRPVASPMTQAAPPVQTSPPTRPHTSSTQTAATPAPHAPSTLPARVMHTRTGCVGPAAVSQAMSLTAGNLQRFLAAQRAQGRGEGADDSCAGSASRRRGAASPDVPAAGESDSEEDEVYTSRVERQVLAYVDSLRGLTFYLDPCPPLPLAGLSPESSAPALPGSETGSGAGSRLESPHGRTRTTDVDALRRQRRAEKMAERAEIEKRIRYVTREQLRQIYLDTHEELVECIEDLMMVEAKVVDLDSDLAVWEKRAALAEEELELARIHLSASDEYNEALMSEKAEAMRKLTESKSELALLSARMVQLQQQARREGAGGQGARPHDGAMEKEVTLGEALGGGVRGGGGGGGGGGSTAPLRPSPPARDDIGAREVVELERGGEGGPEERARERVAACTAAATTAPAKTDRGTSPVSTSGTEVAVLRAELRALRECCNGGEHSSGNGSAAHLTPTVLELQRELAQARTDLARCEHALSLEQQSTRKQLEVEARLLADVAQLARQLRAREQLDCQGRQQRRADAELSREELLGEVSRLRSELVEREATMASLRRQLGEGGAGGHPIVGPGSVPLSDHSGGTHKAAEVGSRRSSSAVYGFEKDYTALTGSLRGATPRSCQRGGDGPLSSASAKAAAITAAARVGVRRVLAPALCSPSPAGDAAAVPRVDGLGTTPARASVSGASEGAGRGLPARVSSPEMQRRRATLFAALEAVRGDWGVSTVSSRCEARAGGDGGGLTCTTAPAPHLSSPRTGDSPCGPGRRGSCVGVDAGLSSDGRRPPVALSTRTHQRPSSAADGGSAAAGAAVEGGRESPKSFPALPLPGMPSSVSGGSAGVPAGHPAALSGTLCESATLAVSASRLGEESGSLASSHRLSVGNTHTVSAPLMEPTQPFIAASASPDSARQRR